MSEIEKNLKDDYLLDIEPTLTKSITSTDLLENGRLITRILFLTCTVFISVWFLQYLWKRRYLYIHSWNIPGPFCFPFIGCAHLFLTSKTNDIIETFIEMQKKSPDIFKAWFGPNLYYVVSSPESIEKILTSPKALDKASLYKFASSALGDGLLTARKQKWRKHRKIIMPAFNQKILDRYQAVFARQGEIFSNNLQKNIGNEDVDLFTLVTNCTLDIICETALGLDMNIQNSNSDLGRELDRIMEIIAIRIANVWHQLEFMWKWYPISKEYQRLLTKLKNFTGSVVKKKIEAHNERSNWNESSHEKESGETLAFLDLILESSNFTEEELSEEVDIFLAAGTDTTASVLCCIFIALGMFPDIQQKVYEEVLDIMGSERGPLPSDLPQMEYTERVIKESLRLFPVAAIFMREIGGDIKVGDMVFPAGSSAVFAPIYIHRHPKYWPDPLKFDPDRFLPENVAKRHNCTYIPFSYGPRNCIGFQFAMMSMKTMVGTVIRRFKIFTKYKSIEDVRFNINLLLKLRDGPQVWVEAR